MGSIPSTGSLSMSTISQQVNGYTNKPVSLRNVSREAYRQNNTFASLNVDPNAISEFKGWSSVAPAPVGLFLNKTGYPIDPEYGPISGTGTVTIVDEAYSFSVTGIPSFSSGDFSIGFFDKGLYSSYIHEWEYITFTLVATLYRNGTVIATSSRNINTNDYDNDAHDSYMNAMRNFWDTDGESYLISKSFDDVVNTDIFRLTVTIAYNSNNATTTSWNSDEPSIFSGGEERYKWLMQKSIQYNYTVYITVGAAIYYAPSNIYFINYNGIPIASTRYWKRGKAEADPIEDVFV